MVKRLWLEMSVAAKHLPVLVPGDEGDLFDCESCFEEAAGPFMSEVVKLKVRDLKGPALSPKRRPD